MKVKHILFFAACINLFSQSDKRDYDEELRYQNQAINGLKKEINQLRLKIKTAESREKSAKNRISSIDQELSLTNELIQSLKKQEEKTRNTISTLRESIFKNEEELKELKVRYENRVVRSYLNGRITDLERVFSSTFLTIIAAYILYFPSLEGRFPETTTEPAGIKPYVISPVALSYILVLFPI